MKKILLAGALCTLAVMTGRAWADVIGTRTNPSSFVVSDGASHFVPLNSSGSLSMPFVTVQDNQRVVVSYNAECTVKGTTTFHWLNLDILVDGVPAPPSSDDNAFCTSRGNNALDGWVSAITQTVIVVPDPGIHTVLVRANLVGFVTGDSWRLDDSTTLVQQ